MSNHNTIFKPKSIVIHCSHPVGLPVADAKTIDGWHKKRGFDMIGYHYVINNGLQKDGTVDENKVGLIEKGRPDDVRGAHCRAGGQNNRALGICLIGVSGRFSPAQYIALEELLIYLVGNFGIPITEIHGHGYFDKKKHFCPGFIVEKKVREIFHKPYIEEPFKEV